MSPLLKHDNKGMKPSNIQYAVVLPNNILKAEYSSGPVGPVPTSGICYAPKWPEDLDLQAEGYVIYSFPKTLKHSGMERTLEVLLCLWGWRGKVSVKSENAGLWMPRLKGRTDIPACRRYVYPAAPP